MYALEKKKCHSGNVKLAKSNLTFQSFGNLSLRINKNAFVIKPSGVNLSKVNYKNYPVIDLNKKINCNNLKPSVDTAFHTEIQKNFEQINCIVHTHSKYATIWAQACKAIPNLGTTHSDYWLGSVPVTKKLTSNQVKKNYEKNIGLNIIKLLKKKFNYGILIANHGPITLGRTLDEALQYSERLEYISEVAYKTLIINRKAKIDKDLINKHYFRKHGKKSYYGQTR